MRLSTIFPDELACTYLSRVRSENVLHSNQELAHALRVAGIIKNLPANAAALLEELLAVLGMSARELVCSHSLVPAQKCVVNYNFENAAPPDFGDKRYLRFAAHGSRVMCLCRDCVHEDLDYWGVSYWRRSHQLTGVTWCLKHLRPLSYVTDSGALDLSPDMAVAYAADRTFSDLRMALDSPVVQRYASIMTSLLENARAPVHYGCAGKVIRDRAVLKGLKVMPSKTARYLSDEAQEQLPESWLDEHFPASKSKKDHEFSPWIDHTGHARTKPASVSAFALALALLWDDPDEAVNIFLGALPDKIKPKSRFGPIARSSERSLREMWLDHKGSHASLADALGVSRKHVGEEFRKLGLPSLGEDCYARALTAIEQFFRGRSLEVASKSAGVDRCKTEALLRVLYTHSGDGSVSRLPVIEHHHKSKRPVGYECAIASLRRSESSL